MGTHGVLVYEIKIRRAQQLNVNDLNGDCLRDIKMTYMQNNMIER